MMIEKVINLLRGKRMAQPPEVSHDTWAEEMHKAYMERLEQLKDQTDFPADEKVMGRLLPLLVEMALRTSDYLMVATDDVNCLKRHTESVTHIRDGTAEMLKPFRRDPTRVPLWVIGIYDALRTMGVHEGTMVIGGYLMDFSD
jgi:hypothetical protein